MIIGIPKEIKNHEYRIGMPPSGVEILVEAGHSVYVQKGAGEGTGIPDEDFETAGAKILQSAKDIFDKSEMIIKVKEPIGPEFSYIHSGQILFTYLHLASGKELTENLLDTGCVGIGYETMENEKGELPLIVPMSEVAGRLAVVEGTKYLQKTYDGRGILISGVPGAEPAKVLIVGAGVVGTNATQMACGLGAEVTVLDKDISKLRQLDFAYLGRLKTIKSTPWTIRKAVREADLIICAVLIPGARTPRLITRDMLKTMKKGAVIVDVSIDQGGCCETSRPTTHSEPIYEVDGIIHYCVANMPGCVPRTSTFALTNETLPYALELANKGWKKACKENRMLLTGLNVCMGKLTCNPVADVFKIPYTPAEEMLN